MKKSFFKNLIFIISIFVLSLLLVNNKINVKASTIVEDGIYEVDIEKHLPMGKEAFSDTVLIEKQNDNYYLTFSIVDIGKISKMNIVSKNKVGTTIIKSDNRIDYTYSLSLDDLSKDIYFKAFINAMKIEKEFPITVKLDSARKTSQKIDYSISKPARFIPTINLSAGNTEMKIGSFYTIVPATATLDEKEVPVTVKVYYLDNGKETQVEVKDNKFMLENVGEYHVTYTAESSKYKNNLGENCINTIKLIIKSKLEATTLAKVENIEGHNILPNDFSIQATLANKESDIYNRAANLMLKVADNFEVMSVNIFDIDGNIIYPETNILLYLNANNQYDRNKIRVFHINDDDTLTEIECDGYGRFVRLATNLTGDFVIALDGLAFVMPMWGYALITILGVIIIAIAIVIPIVIVHKKKKSQKLLNK